MTNTNVISAESYYKAMNNKDLVAMKKYLHPDAHFISPLAEMTGREAILDAASGFFSFFKSLTIRAKFGAGDQVMLALDLDCPQPIRLVRAAVLLTFKDNLIVQSELFLDVRPFEKKQSEIFAQP